jgi:ATP-dependent Clp protease, protease subunit
VFSLMSSTNFKGYLSHVPLMVLGLLLLTVSPDVAAGQSKGKTTTHSRSANASETATPTTSRESEIKLDDWLIEERIVFVRGEIDSDLVESVISKLLYLDHRAPGKDIYLYIISPGGEIKPGLALYDTIRSLRSDVATVGLGQVSSMASILLAGGTKGKRFASQNTRIMIHQPLGGTEGQAADIAIAAKEILSARSLLNRLLSESTGQPLRRIEVDVDRDFFMSAQEAKAYGIVDQVIDQIPSASRPLKK